MKKILSLFVTITLLTASMVSFTGCQNMADIHVDPFEHPESEPKHTVTLPKANAGDLTGDGSIELEYATGEEVSIYLFEYKAAHKFIGIRFVDETRKRLDVPYTLDYDKEAESYKVCFTMPDADIILYRIIIESLPEAEKARANYSFKIFGEYSKIKGDFKFTCSGITIEITPAWIDNSELCEPEVHYESKKIPEGLSYHYEDRPDAYTYYFSVTFKCPDFLLRLLPKDREYSYSLGEYPENTK